MKIKSYEEMNSLEIDALREVGSIGTGNAATALSGLLGKEVRITLPRVQIQGFNEAVEVLGGFEQITAGVLARLTGDVGGVMLAVESMEFVNLLLSTLMGRTIEDYSELNEIEVSMLTEVGNILISSFINAIAGLVDMEIELSVPSMAVDMQGAILSVPMAEMGNQSDYLMTIGGNLVCDGRQTPCHLLLSPDIRSLNFLLWKLGVSHD